VRTRIKIYSHIYTITSMKLGKYSFGIGDRFAMQGEAQLRAMLLAKEYGIEICPVWNKSNREHKFIGSTPAITRKAADQAVATLGWKGSYFVDADHINLTNVDAFLPYSNFFTIDVADFIGQPPSDESLTSFVERNKKFLGNLQIPGIADELMVTHELLENVGQKFLGAIHNAGKIYRHILAQKGADAFAAEISMDEVRDAQTPIELFFILSMIASEGIPASTIAPKFTGRFNKGVDYVGDLQLFEKEFEQDLMVIDYAVKIFGLPNTLKLSVHSGSDKFSIYPVMGRLIKKHNAGIHVKTAGTTWLEETIGLSMAEGEGLALVKRIYAGALNHFDELTAPYATVIDIDKQALPTAETVNHWTGQQLANALRHIPDHREYNPNMRQLVHVAFKLAAKEGQKYLDLLAANKDIVGSQVTENIFDRHIKRLFS